MTLRNDDTIEFKCFVMHMKYRIEYRQTFLRLSRDTWPVVMAMDIVALVSYIYHGKSMVQVLSPGEKFGVGFRDWICSPAISCGRALSNPIAY